MINCVLRNILAQFDQALRQVGNHVVHQVLADGLGPLVKQIALLLPNFFHFLGHRLFFYPPFLRLLLLSGFVFFLFLLGLQKFLLFFPDKKVDLVQIFVGSVGLGLGLFVLVFWMLHSFSYWLFRDRL